MAEYFFDTSALVKLYHTEKGTEAVAAILAEPGRRIRISLLGFLEMQSAFALKVRSGALERSAAGIQRARLMLDIAAGELEVLLLTHEHFEVAERLIGRRSFTQRLRTLDALQLAVAVGLRKEGRLDSFVAADKALLEIAVLEGLPVLNPEVT